MVEPLPAESESSPPGSSTAAGRLVDGNAWREVVAQIGSAVALPLSAALERVNALATTGRIDRDGVRALRDEIESARRVAMVSQQLARFASRRVRLQPESVDLTLMLREALAQRAREAAARQVGFSQVLKATTVMVDPALLYTLVQALLDWMLDVARSPIECRLEADGASGQARWSMRFAVEGARDEGRFSPGSRPLASADADALAWRLVEQIAAILTLPLARDEAGGYSAITLMFPASLQEKLAAIAAQEPETGFGSTMSSLPLAGSQVLVIASRRDVRTLVRDAVRHMGLVLDFVPNIEEAEEFCRDGLPHAIICEAVLHGHRYDKLRAGIVAELPGFVFIEIEEEGRALELRSQAVDGRTRIGRDAILESLPTALLFELAAPA